jgi:2-methylcitrate dehydratase
VRQGGDTDGNGDRRIFLKGSGALMLSAITAKAALGCHTAEADPSDAPKAANAPEPVTSGPSQTEGIARFALRTKYEDLSPERRERLEVSVLDALACAINALRAPPIEACRAQAEAFGGPGGRCTLIGGGQSNPIDAAFYNTALVRYVDFMDSYLAGSEICHPSDNTAAVLAASEFANLAGKDFLVALAVAYQVESRLTASAPFMAHGFDLTTQLSYSLATGVSKALGLDEAKTTSALGICGDIIPLLVVRATPISQWKGLSSAQLAHAAVHGVFLASRGVTGPRYVIEGPNGLAHALGQPIRVNWESEKLDAFDHLALKSYNTAVPGQASVHCMLELRKANAMDPAKVEKIENDVFLDAYNFMGGGTFGPKLDVHTKEDADHSLPYLLAVALLDGQVQPAQLEPARIASPDVQALLKRVQVKPDPAFSARYPRETPSRVTVSMAGGQSSSHEVRDYPGFATRPFTWDEVGAKFDNLVGDHVDAGLRREIKAAVRALESIPVSELTNLLGRVNAR